MLLRLCERTFAQIAVRDLCTSEDGCDISISISLFMAYAYVYVSVVSIEDIVDTNITIADWLKVFRS